MRIMKTNSNLWKSTGKQSIVPIISLLAVAVLSFGLLKVSAAGNDTGLKIKKSEVTSTAKFYPYKAGNTYMEVIAVKASDGTVRTALNTCQVCFDSGRGYYTQQGDQLICNNCGNRFLIDQIEKVKLGCNPVPIMKENKKEDTKYITISKAFLEQNKALFARWKR